jgi:hypothetical protein
LSEAFWLHKAESQERPPQQQQAQLKKEITAHLILIRERFAGLQADTRRSLSESDAMPLSYCRIAGVWDHQVQGKRSVAPKSGSPLRRPSVGGVARGLQGQRAAALAILGFDTEVKTFGGHTGDDELAPRRCRISGRVTGVEAIRLCLACTQVDGFIPPTACQQQRQRHRDQQF